MLALCSAALSAAAFFFFFFFGHHSRSPGIGVGHQLGKAQLAVWASMQGRADSGKAGVPWSSVRARTGADLELNASNGSCVCIHNEQVAGSILEGFG